MSITAASCKRCGKLIFSADGDFWIHANQDFNRGCRAASFEAGIGWDDSLDRRWTAAPA